MTKSENARIPEVPVLVGPQGPRIRISGHPERERLVNLSSNDYLSLVEHPAIVEAAVRALREFGFGMASVRFISGSHDLHARLEHATAELTGQPAAAVFPSCFDANAGLFEALLGPDDMVLSDELNHASIIDGVRLCRARRIRYPHADVDAVRDALRDRPPGGTAAVVTDGVFSMDGSLAPLRELLEVTRAHDALLIVDDSHGIGVLGATGRGTTEHLDMLGEVDIVTGTFGKALGGAAGGFVAASASIVDAVRRRSRPYLFSNALPPHVVAGSLAAISVLRESPERVTTLRHNAAALRASLTDAGFELLPGFHPIIPVMTRHLDRTAAWVETSRRHGALVTGIRYPVVARGTERIRLQVSAGHTPEDLATGVDALLAARQEHE